MIKPADASGKQIQTSPGLSRRAMVQVSTAIAAAPLVGCAAGPGGNASGAGIHTTNSAANVEPDPVMMRVNLQVNGQAYPLTLDGRTSLLDALRENMNLKGSKKGCDHGQCGACTVLVNGKRVLSCLTLAAGSTGKEITTIEGLKGANGELHPVQQAFIDHDAFQCGYCTPGQIMSAIGCLAERHADDDAAIREYMSGNICRCAAYPNIVEAVKQARDSQGI